MTIRDRFSIGTSGTMKSSQESFLIVRSCRVYSCFLLKGAEGAERGVTGRTKGVEKSSAYSVFLNGSGGFYSFQ